MSNLPVICRQVRVVVLIVLLHAGASISAATAEDAICRLTLELVDAESGATLSGLVQIRDERDQLVRPPELLDRGQGLDPKKPIHDWSVLLRPTTVTVPRKQLRFRAFFGLETAFATAALDLRERETALLRIPLRRFAAIGHNSPRARRSPDAAPEGTTAVTGRYQSANTHVHLQKVSRQESDRYLLETATADGLDIVFVSYLERAEADLEYTTNKYTRQELRQLSTDWLKFENGEEHRHNFEGFLEGYGHVMLLNIPELIQPVSIGPGITKRGTDGLPLRAGIQKARDLGATVIWCHNAWGLEDVPNWISGKLHANNIFDGGTHGSYKHSFYRYLNAGLRVPFSTGTDWFIYDFSRVYIPTEHPLTPEAWLQKLAAGRSFITNGPLLEFSVQGKLIGDTIELAGPGRVSVRAVALGRIDFRHLELIKDGAMIHRAASKAVSQPAEHFAAEFQLDVDISGPCWLALRTPPPAADRDPEFQQPTPLNEYGCELFSHTSAVYVRVAGQDPFQVAAAIELLDEMKRGRELIARQALFADETERMRVLAIYDEAIADWNTRIKQAWREHR